MCEPDKKNNCSYLDRKREDKIDRVHNILMLSSFQTRVLALNTTVGFYGRLFSPTFFREEVTQQSKILERLESQRILFVN